MKTARVGNDKVLRFTFSVGILTLIPNLVILSTLAASGDDIPSAEQVRSSTIITPSAKNTATTQTQSRAGARILSDDNDDADDVAKSKTTAPAGKGEGLTINYTETAATDALCKQGVAYIQQKKYPQAVAVATTAIRNDPRTITARRLYAQSTLLNQQPELSIEMLNVLATYTTPTVFDKCTLGSAYYCKSNGSQAKVAFSEALSLAPGYFYAEEGYIQSLILSGDYATGVSECSAARAKFKSPSEQATILKLYAKMLAQKRENQQYQPPVGDSRLLPPIPLQQMTRYQADHEYGG